jgi:acid phosphatase family membrane protein YuiD
MGGIFQNPVLIAGIIAASLAQIVKVPLEYLHSREWDWTLLFSTGGMPSSHSALVVSVALGTGLFSGFDSPLFAVAFALAMVVTYDAAGVRRQAGFHAQKINLIFNELLNGQPVPEEQLKEVLGHSPWEVMGGTFLGIVTTLTVWLLWK